MEKAVLRGRRKDDENSLTVVQGVKDGVRVAFTNPMLLVEVSVRASVLPGYDLVIDFRLSLQSQNTETSFCPETGTKVFGKQGQENGPAFSIRIETLLSTVIEYDESSYDVQPSWHEGCDTARRPDPVA